MEFVFEFHAANQKATASQINHSNSNSSNISRSGFTVQVDVGCFPNGSTGWGLTIRNQMGLNVHTECKTENITCDPLVVEALGMR